MSRSWLSLCAACFRFAACLQLDGSNMAVAGSHAIAQHSVINKTAHAGLAARTRSIRRASIITRGFMAPSELAASAHRHRLVWRSLGFRLFATVVALIYTARIDLPVYRQLDWQLLAASAHRCWLACCARFGRPSSPPPACAQWWAIRGAQFAQRASDSLVRHQLEKVHHGWFDHRAKSTADHDHTHTCGTSCPWRRTSVPHRGGRPAGVR